MEAQTIARANYLDILFNNRNKLYGSYVLRKYYGRRMAQALSIVVGACITLVTWGMLPGNHHTQNTVPPVFKDSMVLVDVHPPITPPPPPPPEPPKPPEPPAAKPTVKNPLPVLKPDDIVTETPPDIDSLAGRESGLVTTGGDPNGVVPATTKEKGTGTEPVAPPPPKVITFSDVMPAFKGDVYAYLGREVRYPPQAVAEGIEGKVIVQFVVYEDGSIQDVKVARGIGGGCDEEAVRVVRNMPPWSPGENNGQKVRVSFMLPITFRLQ